MSATVSTARLRLFPLRPGRIAHVEAALRELAVQDLLLLVYLLVLFGFSIAGDGPRRVSALTGLTGDLLLLGIALAITRGRLVRGTLGALVYRAGLFGAVFGSFTQLQYILPTARSVRVDAQLYAFDRAVFGIEPAEIFDRFVTPAATEWFSFFYFGYFLLLAVHVFPFMFAVRNVPLLAEFSLGFIALFCIGHLLYIVVPGYGPYQHLAGQFTHALDGPVWWRLVKSTVDAGEVTARTDIFPSLHTAAPTYLALFSFRHRKAWPFRVAWPLLGLFASQIVISTMFLRWHYLVDVVAGLILAGGVSVFAARIARWEGRFRDATGRRPVWTTLSS